jgi:phage head maturation protease
LNRDHQRERVVGKAIALNPWAEEGLTGTLKLAKTAAADEALTLIDDDILSVSAGFAIAPGGEQWQGDTRRIKKALLDHVALIADAAYLDAKVTASRSDHILAGARV